MPKKNIIIIGSGVAGLATALRLSHAGYQVRFLSLIIMLVERCQKLDVMDTGLILVRLFLQCLI